jgi:hypothetical protein
MRCNFIRKKSKKVLKNMDLEQARFVVEKEIIKEVITLQEAAEILNCGDSTLRKHVLIGKFIEGEYRKAKGVILFNKNVILKMKIDKDK